MEDNILILASAGALYAKLVVDLAKMATDLPRWAAPILAIVVAIASLVVLMIANEQPLTQALIAQAVLAGFLAGGSAVGVTELHKRARE